MLKTGLLHCMLFQNKFLHLSYSSPPKSQQLPNLCLPHISLLIPKLLYSQNPFSLSPFWFQNFAIFCLANGSSFSFKKYDGLAFIVKIKNNPQQTACDMWFPESPEALGTQIRNRSNCHWHLPKKTDICIYSPDPGWLQIDQWLIQTSSWAPTESSSGGKKGKGQSSGNWDWVHFISPKLTSNFL